MKMQLAALICVLLLHVSVQQPWKRRRQFKRMMRNLCNIQSCPVGQTLNKTYCRCEVICSGMMCSNGLPPNPVDCSCNTTTCSLVCTLPQIVDQFCSSCTCPRPPFGCYGTLKSYNMTTCVCECPNITCPSNYVPNLVTCKCDYSPSTTVCALTCGINQAPNSTCTACECKLQCTSGVFPNSTCTACECPYWLAWQCRYGVNSTTCQCNPNPSIPTSCPHWDWRCRLGSSQ